MAARQRCFLRGSRFRRALLAIDAAQGHAPYVVSPMNDFSEDRRALTHWGGKPIYGTTILTLLYALGLIVSVLLQSARFRLEPFGFYAPQFFSGAIWQPITYSFIAQPSFFTLFSFLCLYLWAVEIERFLGRAHLW